MVNNIHNLANSKLKRQKSDMAFLKEKGLLPDFNLAEDKVFFFGDKTMPGGNDYPLAKKLKNVYQVSSWTETWETLVYLKEAKIAE